MYKKIITKTNNFTFCTHRLHLGNIFEKYTIFTLPVGAAVVATSGCAIVTAVGCVVTTILVRDVGIVVDMPSNGWAVITGCGGITGLVTTCPKPANWVGAAGCMPVSGSIGCAFANGGDIIFGGVLPPDGGEIPDRGCCTIAGDGGTTGGTFAGTGDIGGIPGTKGRVGWTVWGTAGTGGTGGFIGGILLPCNKFAVGTIGATAATGATKKET